jgi:hypothetical protein
VRSQFVGSCAITLGMGRDVFVYVAEHPATRQLRLGRRLMETRHTAGRSQFELREARV